MRAISECRLYGIIDLGYVGVSDVTRVAEQMIEGSVDLIQLRGKGKSVDELAGFAARLHEITARSLTPLIVNDHAEIAREIPAEGVHVGQEDDSIELARRKAHRKIHTQHRASTRSAARERGLYRIRPDLRYTYETRLCADWPCGHQPRSRRSQHPDFLYWRNQHRQSTERDRRRSEARRNGFRVDQGAQHCGLCGLCD